MLALVNIVFPWFTGQDMAMPAFTDIVIYAFAGLLWGLYMWHMMEKRYAKELAQTQFGRDTQTPDA